jgi:hypothetical protein
MKAFFQSQLLDHKANVSSVLFAARLRNFVLGCDISYPGEKMKHNHKASFRSVLLAAFCEIMYVLRYEISDPGRKRKQTVYTYLGSN